VSHVPDDVARLTRLPVHALGLSQGMAVWVQIKAAALMG
jgi:ABC-type molybdate transport system ATPase subunit